MIEWLTFGVGLVAGHCIGLYRLVQRSHSCQSDGCYASVSDHYDHCLHHR